MNQLEKLKQLSDKMVGIVIAEADPDTWAGANKKLDEMSEDERGDRYWCKKNANQVITTAVKLETLIALYERKGSQPKDNKVTELSDKVIQFEQAAKERLERLANG
ncbi:hypothetical protein [uncultured Gilliamella sp.]|uniref:hypothetical protein n=1 Tax=uncultured Gilliamella sp. TaxID=1193505 RepID=UPI0025F94489|nr:hypothetical protein [uncultured Gilliamella sp.]